MDPRERPLEQGEQPAKATSSGPNGCAIAAVGSLLVSMAVLASVFFFVLYTCS